MSWNENVDPLGDLQAVIEQSKSTGLVLRRVTIDDLRSWASSWPNGWMWVKILKEMFDHQYREGIDEVLLANDQT